MKWEERRLMEVAHSTSHTTSEKFCCLFVSNNLWLIASKCLNQFKNMQNFTLQLESIDGGDAAVLGTTIITTDAVVGGMNSSSNHFTEFIIISKICNWFCLSEMLDKWKTENEKWIYYCLSYGCTVNLTPYLSELNSKWKIKKSLNYSAFVKTCPFYTL